MQDAHNLAWKLAAVLNNTASPKLLESYQAERKPVAQANTDLSVANWHEAVKVPKALGLDPRAANLLNAVVGSGPMSLLPEGKRLSACARNAYTTAMPKCPSYAVVTAQTRHLSKVGLPGHETWLHTTFSKAVHDW